MRYPKMLPCEVLLQTTGSGIGYGLLHNIMLGGGDDKRLPLDHSASFASGLLGNLETLIAPDNSYALYITGTGATGIRKLDFATGLMENAAQVVTGTAYSAAWLPDKTKFLVGVNSDPYLEHWDTATLTKDVAQPSVGWITSGVTNRMYAPRFNPAGDKFVAATHAAPYGYVVNYPSFTIDTVLSALPGVGRASSWSPDGNWVAIGTDGGTQRVNLYDTATWTRQTLSANIGQSFDSSDLSFNPTSEYLLGTAGATGTTSGPPIAITLLRLSDLTIVPTPVPAGHQFGSSSAIRWVGDYKAFWISPTNNFGYVGFLLDVLTGHLDFIYLDIISSSGMGGFSDGFTLRRLAGNVVDANNVPVSRTLRAYHRASGILIGESVSSEVDGSFDFYVFTSEPLTVVAVGAGAEITKLYDSVTGAFLE